MAVALGSRQISSASIPRSGHAAAMRPSSVQTDAPQTDATAR